MCYCSLQPHQWGNLFRFKKPKIRMYLGTGLWLISLIKDSFTMREEHMHRQFLPRSGCKSHRDLLVWPIFSEGAASSAAWWRLRCSHYVGLWGGPWSSWILVPGYCLHIFRLHFPTLPEKPTREGDPSASSQPRLPSLLLLRQHSPSQTFREGSQGNGLSEKQAFLF